MRNILVVFTIYCVIATFAWLRALVALADERRESRQAWEQVQELRASAAGGWPILF